MLTASRIVAAVCTALCFVVPAAHAQEAQVADAPSADVRPETAFTTVRVIDAKVTAYATGADGGAVGEITATGVRTHWGTVAADWRLHPPGTRLLIEGFPNDVFVVEDTGGGVRGDLFDIWFPDLATAVAFGTKSLRVSVLTEK
jgi:3D (Asp-Asp-Asp) domain-containing protein